MKSSVLLQLIVFWTSVAPKPSKLNYRNLYKVPTFETKTRQNPRVIGGQEAEPHSIPYQVFLEVHSETQLWYCGGSLVSQNYILTAGHCGVNAKTFYITLGAHRPLQTEETHLSLTSEEVTIHENFDGDQIINDLALIKLPQPVTFTPEIQPTVLPTYADANQTYAGVLARVSGWGLTSMYETKPAEVLNYLDMDVISNEKCEEWFKIIPSILCTSGENNTGACSGDSGGPLVVDGVQVGVDSFGVIFCMPGYPTGFTRLTSFLGWIEHNSDVKIKAV